MVKMAAIKYPPILALDPITSFPATKTRKDVEQACFGSPFSNLATDAGACETIIPQALSP